MAEPFSDRDPSSSPLLQDLPWAPVHSEAATAYGIPAPTSATDAAALLPWPAGNTTLEPLVGGAGAGSVVDALAPGVDLWGLDPITGLPDPHGSGAQPSPPTPRRDLVVIDDAAEGLDALASALESAGYAVLRVGSVRDPLAAVQQHLQQHPLAGPLHLFGHGSPGRFVLGRAVISPHSIPYQQERWAAIGALLADGVSIRL